jgi:N utilization substance protein B
VHDEELYEFAWFLFIGVMERRDELDARIEPIAQNWSLKRMAPTDRNVLRLGAYELLFMNTPPKVAINEALEMAKRYGSAQSSQFVNGILDRLMPPEKKDDLRETEEQQPAVTLPGGEEEPRPSF